MTPRAINHKAIRAENRKKILALLQKQRELTLQEIAKELDLSVPTVTTIVEQLIEEGFVRELTSKIQTMRKEAGFEVMDRIRVYAKGNEKIQKIMTDNKESISHDVLADDFIFGETQGYVKDWKINSEPVTLGVEKQ